MVAQPNAPGIRLSLAALSIACILPIVLIAAILIFNVYERQQEQLIVDTMSRVKAISSAVDRDFAITQSALQALSNAGSLDKGDFTAFQTQAIETAKSLHVSNIVLLDLNAQPLMSTNRALDQLLPKLDKPLLMQHILETGKPEVSDLFWGPILNRYIYAIGVPVTRNGQVVYTLNAAATNEQLHSILKDQGLPESWNVIVSDSVGNVVINLHDQDKSLGKKIIPRLMQRLSTSTEEAFETTTQTGSRMFVVYNRSTATGWTISVYMPLDEVKGNRSALALMILSSIVALGVGLTLAWLIGGKITSSITALIKPARALGSRERVDIPTLFFKEANALRQALLDAEMTLRTAQHEALHDPLTGMANRAMFELTVEQQLLLCQRNHSALSIMYIDLDGFKAVNDTHGHGVGDLLLVEVASRIKSAARRSDVAARVGGDEFVIALINSDAIHGQVIAKTLLNELSEPYQFGDIEARISASIGIAGFPESGTDLSTLLKSADQAMYEAKTTGKRRICLAAAIK